MAAAFETLLQAVDEAICWQPFPVSLDYLGGDSLIIRKGPDQDGRPRPGG